MGETWVIFKREFEAMVRTKSFLIGTILVPALMIGIFAFQFFLFTKTGGGTHSLAIVDGSAEQVGMQTERSLSASTGGFPGAKPVIFKTEVQPLGADTAEQRKRLEERIAADSLGGYLWIPEGITTGANAEYIGRNATNEGVTDAVKQALQRSVQTIRLGKQGIDPDQVSTALTPVRMTTTKTGARGQRGSAGMATALAMAMGFVIYMIVAIYGAGVLNAVLEEKRDRIVEVIVSSAKASSLLTGKVAGVGAAGLVQLALWVLTVFVALKFGPAIVQLFGVSAEKAEAFAAGLRNFPRVPTSTTIMFLLYFLGGFFIYATLYAMLGAIATNNQEAQQLVFPVMMPLILSFLMLQPSVMNPDGGVALAGSLIPFTSPIIMPARAVVTEVPWWQVGLSFALLFATIAGVIWLGAKIYRIGIFSTGKRASMKEVWHWVRTV